MSRRVIHILLSVILVCGCTSRASCDRCVFLDLSGMSACDPADSTEMLALWDAMHLTSTMQGIVNRDAPRLYVKYVTSEGSDTDQFWWDEFIGSGKWLSGIDTVRLTDPVEAAEHFRGLVRGLVVYDSDMAATSNLASTVAGAEDLLAVRYDPSEGSVYSRLVNNGWKTVVSLVGQDGSPKFATKSEAYGWAVENYLKKGKCSAEYAGYYIDQFWRRCAGNAVTNHHLLTNHDFFVSRKAFFFDLSPWEDEPATDAPSEAVGADNRMLRTILLEMYRQRGGDGFCHIGGFPSWPYKYTDFGQVGGKHGPVATEWEFARIIGEYNAFKDADAASYGALANASFWQHYPLKERYSQKGWVSCEDLKAKGYLTPDGKVDMTKRFVLFYVGDYDSSAWLYQRMPQIWNDPARGKLPLMWNISPVLERRVPMVMEYLWETATDNDFFAAADNGAGYLNPGSLEEPRLLSGLPSGVDAWAAHCAPFYRRWDLTVTGFVIDGSAKGMSEEGFRSYARFSPNGICPMLSPDCELVDGMPVFRVNQTGPDSDDPVREAEIVAAAVEDHPDFPFYWFRTVLKTPSWHLQVKESMEERSKDAVWVSAPEFFELLRCYNEYTFAE